MNRKMRNAKKDLGEATGKSILAGGEYGVLSLAERDGTPYGVPLSYVYDEKEKALYFHGALEGKKIDLILENPEAAFTVVTDVVRKPAQFTTAYRSAMAFGRASLVTGEERRSALLLFIDKYAPDHREAGTAYVDRSGEATALIKLSIDRITAKGTS